MLFPDFDTDAVFPFSRSRKGRLYLPAHRDLHLAADACLEIGWSGYSGISSTPTGGVGGGRGGMGREKKKKRKKRREKEKERKARWKRVLERKGGEKFQCLVLTAIS